MTSMTSPKYSVYGFPATGISAMAAGLFGAAKTKSGFNSLIGPRGCEKSRREGSVRGLLAAVIQKASSSMCPGWAGNQIGF